MFANEISPTPWYTLTLLIYIFIMQLNTFSYVNIDKQVKCLNLPRVIGRAIFRFRLTA